eukprot:CAMPEP_0168331138 /NCGR_PEP_ID=MMETSP0213-20121227/8154_1 /TAXON_ID=151035 /ORGANISM="Euplotes harpa, Strain FSP1.4" /LENGTH=95 /DNA_ID=CAMNT_0008334855 /DNA_START=112 /DNA_END=399 /DNA_ORIENTATION=-
MNNHNNKQICTRNEKNERMHESDIVSWIKKHRPEVVHKEYKMSKDEFKWEQEIHQAFVENNIDEKSKNLSRFLTNVCDTQKPAIARYRKTRTNPE